MKRRAGFTLIELVIAIIVIAILATIVLVNYNAAQAKARDTRRMSNLNSISEAITSYRVKYGNPVTTSCSGGLTATPGTGWFNDSTDTGSGYSGTTILSCLTAKGYLDNTAVDPSGCSNASGASAPGYTCKGSRYGIGYVKLNCVDPSNANQTITVLLAKLEASGSTSNLTGSNALCSSDTWATNYGYNYMVRVD